MLRGCWRLVRNRSCVSGSWNLENVTTHGQTGSTIHCSRPPAEHSVRGKLNGEVARHARHARHPRSILARMSRVSGVSMRMSRVCYEETAAVELRLFSTRRQDDRTARWPATVHMQYATDMDKFFSTVSLLHDSGESNKTRQSAGGVNETADDGQQSRRRRWRRAAERKTAEKAVVTGVASRDLFCARLVVTAGRHV